MKPTGSTWGCCGVARPGTPGVPPSCAPAGTGRQVPDNPAPVKPAPEGPDRDTVAPGTPVPASPAPDMAAPDSPAPAMGSLPGDQAVLPAITSFGAAGAPTPAAPASPASPAGSGLRVFCAGTRVAARTSLRRADLARRR